MRTTIAIGLTLVLAGPAVAQAPPVIAPAPAAPSAAATRIAGLLASEEVVLTKTRRVLRQQLPAVLNANPDMHVMEERWPGITAEFIDVMEPIIAASLKRRLPDYQREVATMFDKRMSHAELEVAGTFYDSAAGRHMMTLVRDGVDYSTLLKQQVEAEGKAQVSGADLRAAITPALRPAMAELSGAEQLMMLSFARTDAGRKMVSINQELLGIAVRFNNDKDAQSEAEITKAVTALVERRAAATKKRQR